MSELYKQSGVNLSEANRLANKLVKFGGNFQAFAGELNCRGLKIVNCCDGIGTKIIPLYEKKLFKTIAIDLVAANLNDLATKNAKALGFLDYIAVNSLDSESISKIIFEIKNVLSNFGCELLGGETSEMPDLLKNGVIDICGFVTGIADENSIPSGIQSGDIVIALKSNGIHANGFSLIRKLYADGKLSEEEFLECLKPTFIYYNAVQNLWQNNLIKSAANITGGGIYSNIIRVVPEHLDLDLDFCGIQQQGIYKKLYNLCGDEIYEVFNCGAGFCLIADAADADKIFDICKCFDPFILGKVVEK